MDSPHLPRSKRASIAGLVGLLLVGGAALWLARHVSPPILEGDGRLFFGRWRTRDFALACALAWLAAALWTWSLGARALRRWLALWLTCAGLALVLEGVSRLGWVDFAALLGVTPPAPVGSRLGPHARVQGRSKPDIAQRLGLAVESVAFDYRTDRYGWRNHVDRDRADVYLVGDSFLVGGLVPFEELLCARLERELARPVLNCARVNQSVQAASAEFFERAFPLADRAVVQFVFEGNDLLDSAAWRAAHGASSAAPPAQPRTFLHSLVVRLQRLTQPQPTWSRWRVGELGNAQVWFHWVRQSFQGVEGEVSPILADLDATRARVEAAGGRFGVVLIPTKFRVLGPLCRFAPDADLNDSAAQLGPLPGALASWALRTGTAYLDLTEALTAAARAGQVPWFEADTHWNSAGHGVAARELARFAPLAALAAAQPGTEAAR